MRNLAPAEPKAQPARASALVDTRISRREQRPRRLPAEGGESDRNALARSRAKYLSRLRERIAAKALAEQQPAYLRACFKNPARHRTYWVYTWNPHDPTNKTRIPYVCGSWRCEFCQQHAGHVLFARLQEAFKPCRARAVVFVVLTLDPQWHRVAVHDLSSVYRDFSKRQALWMKRLERYLKERYGYHHRSQWASVTECHRSGVPHVNIAIHHPDWARDLADQRDASNAAGLSEFEATRLDPELSAHAAACGFGWRCTAEANRYGDTEAISGYLVKGVKRADAMHGELAKLSQLPLMAPKNFRRLRAGKGFVPPKHRGRNTGTIIRRYVSPEGDEQTEPLSRPRFVDCPDDPEQFEAWAADRARKLAYMAEVNHCREIEQALAWRDEGFKGREAIAPPGTERDDLVQGFTRCVDGSTRAGSLVVIDAPRPRPPPHPPPESAPAPQQLTLVACAQDTRQAP